MIFVPDLKHLSIVLKRSSEYSKWAEEYLADLQNYERIDSGSASLFYKQDQFDTDLFDLKVGKIEHVIGDDPGDIQRCVKLFFKQHKFDYLIVRLPQHFSLWLQAFEHQGAYFLDSTVDLVADLHQIPIDSSYQSKLVTDQIVSKDTKSILEISRSFGAGRFFTDPVLKKGQQAYELWIKNSLTKKAADRVFIYKKSGKVHGIMTIKKTNLGKLKGWKVPLIGKHQESQQPKVAETMLKQVLYLAKKEKINFILIGTQGTNTAAVRSYLNAGFGYYSGSITLGWRRTR